MHEVPPTRWAELDAAREDMEEEEEEEEEDGMCAAAVLRVKRKILLKFFSRSGWCFQSRVSWAVSLEWCLDWGSLQVLPCLPQGVQDCEGLREPREVEEALAEGRAFFSRSVRALSWVHVSQAGEQMRNGG